MRRAAIRFALLAGLACPAAFGQFGLFVTDTGGERAVGGFYDYGAAAPGETLAVRFRIRNISATAASLTGLVAAGSGFGLTNGPALPAVLPAGAVAEFTVEFRASYLGAYSAALVSDGISVLLTARVDVRLTYGLEGANGVQPIGPGPVDFGSVERGGTVERRFVILNQTSATLVVPPIVLPGADFEVTGAGPAGNVLGPGESAHLDVEFRPPTAGPRSGTLFIGDRTYLLEGMAVDPTLPRPRLTVTLAKAASAQQGTVAVDFDAAAKIGGTGTLTLEFASGLQDSGVAFGTGARTLSFEVAPGDTAAHFGDQATVAFQTGTTAGTLTITVELGGLTDRQAVTIDRAPIVLNDVKAVRTGAALEVQVTGFDNTRTAGEIVFTFFDAAGNTAAPGAIRIDAAADFARYFAASDLGGLFSVKAVFPVTGDASKIAAVAVQIANAVGSTQSGRTAF